MKRLLDSVGWPDEVIRARPYPGGASLAVSAPLDGLDTAVDLLEWAWDAAVSQLEGRPGSDLTSAATTFRQRIEDEKCPELVALA